MPDASISLRDEKEIKQGGSAQGRGGEEGWKRFIISRAKETISTGMI